MADLSVTVDGLKLPNPFVIGSGPPGTNANVIGKAFDEGWGAVIAKTISLDASKVVNVARATRGCGCPGPRQTTTPRDHDQRAGIAPPTGPYGPRADRRPIAMSMRTSVIPARTNTIHP